MAAALVALRIGYINHLAAYLKFFSRGIRYSCCPINGTRESDAEAEAASASASSDLEKKFRSHSN